MPRDISSEHYKKRHREISRKHRMKNYLKIFARAAAKTLPWKPCEVCKDKKSEAHHDDYKKPYTVRWLCKKHHEEVDTELERKRRNDRGK